MSKYTKLLTGLVVFQLIITVLVFTNESTLESNTVQQALLSKEKGEPSKIHIVENDVKLTLTHHDGRWRIDDYPDLPLIDSKISAITTELAETQIAWPVTSTKSSHERFKVTNENYEKRITFIDTTDYEQSILMGKSPRFGHVYVRKMEQDDVFSIEFSPYQLSTDVNSWFDKSILAINSISQIKHAAINLEKQGEEWQLAPPSALTNEQSLDNESIENFVNQLTRLSVSGVAKTSIIPTNKLTVYDEQNNQYVFAFAANESNYFVKREDIEYWFTISKDKFERFVNLSLDQFTLDNESLNEKEEKNSE